MNFPTALGAVLNGARATRLRWNNPQKYIHLDQDLGKIRYETPSKEHQDIRRDWSYYPTQVDMLATDWELVSDRGR